MTLASRGHQQHAVPVGCRDSLVAANGRALPPGRPVTGARSPKTSNRTLGTVTLGGLPWATVRGPSLPTGMVDGDPLGPHHRAHREARGPSPARAHGPRSSPAGGALQYWNGSGYKPPSR